ncbi:transcription initiation factor TFIIH subunit 2 [Sporothrix schenckii 1099-18]|uniref:Transcription initiation factor TFIIH subunit 2 n=1 Tax=Sporothrix schenckii 1099-18 TaxID=1397361 RepID=A0A0F2MBK0_SPOSC|nr:transcription initiation factor TFIIH subunit 2 [Sporothrix schenckii 1099-18]KJR87007.1 transcription initiation factor TFIIH subunit 2 [Sporothrix schenckii 1099-18]
MADSDGEYVENQSDDGGGGDDHYMTLERGEDRQPAGQRHGRHLQVPGAHAPRRPGGPTSNGRPHQSQGPGQGQGLGQGQRQTRRKQTRQKQQASWETVKRSWDTVVEAADGQIVGIELLEAAEKRRRVLRDTTPLQRGIIRHMVLVLDMSIAMAARDYLPSCHRVALNCAATFVRAYFEQNPISQLAIIAMRDGVALRVSDMGGNPAEHLEKLHEWDNVEPQGHPSLQNALEMCRGALFHTPSHGTREVLVIFGALLSSDPGDIHDTIGALLTDRIRVSIVGLAAQVAICSEICTRTNGGDDRSYNVALHDVHFRELFLAATTPPATQAAADQSNPASLLMMGFPSRAIADSHVAGGGGLSVCACHNKPVREGYACTRCRTKVCRLPAECPACGLTLILSTHLARSYHHLFPLRNWSVVSWVAAAAAVRQRGATACHACLVPFPDLPPPERLRELQAAADADADADAGDKERSGDAGADTAGGRPTQKQQGTAGAAQIDASTDPAAAALNNQLKGVSESSRYACEVCGHHFCIDCDVFAHEVVHNCPGCQSDTRPPAEKEADARARAAEVAAFAAAAAATAAAAAASANSAAVAASEAGAMANSASSSSSAAAIRPKTKILLKARGSAAAAPAPAEGMVID